MSEKRSIAAKLQHLYSTVHPPDRGPYSYREVAEGIAGHTGAMTAQYIGQLMSGKVEHPKVHYLEALAEFYGVPASYFFDDDVASEIDNQISAVTSWRDTEAGEIAQRISDLSPEHRTAVTGLIDQLSTYERQDRGRGRRRRRSAGDSGNA